MQTYAGLRIGNYLYFALHAYLQQRSGRDFRVLDSGLDPDWHNALPRLSPLLASQREGRRRQRSHIPSSFYQRFGVDFTVADVEEFVRAVVLPDLPEPAEVADLVVNVRRGDYYSDAGFRSLYAFDISDFVRRAVIAAAKSGPSVWTSVVSDDPEWCRGNLGWLNEHTDRLTFSAPGAGPVANFSGNQLG